MAVQPTITKITFLQWLKHPTTALLILTTTIAYGVTWAFVQSKLSEVDYLKERIVILEKREEERTKELQDYVRTILFKDAQLNKQKNSIDSLRNDITIQ